ncbi:GPN-loop GTPase [Chloropicon primus]|uniref:GPN-loop GTPase n=1 Tax=Chloropicon primus TaxID=1764295 RepID=A0A5B8MXR9_9CHLO|nr:GPN-loop GTPase [Chloropicon primus]UPR03704.1 GPN-loop GTPase [Chloropicon primus]|mmetsp:Transcript_6377/g.18910  ORF Transcript_6377/g.18910 Transcript_6377/m.18910 type:complete len:328 (-) Transcript_6377:21-1004(-)|eukprot:QDZ24495.1 GPN-loop GTPase [Chloropicon primus]
MPDERREEGKRKPVVVLTMGMAGSGKTTFVQRCIAHLHQKANGMKEEDVCLPYVINLDPAVTHVPYEANIDIRDTVHYKELMQEYGLGPNGGLLTAVNLFATKFDQVVELCERRAAQESGLERTADEDGEDEDERGEAINYIIGDTPGQIEVFTWSASGQIFAESFASQFPTCIAFVVDTPKCTEPRTFMSNMLQACSVLYKYKLPMILVYNKCDISRHEFAIEWMKDFENYQQAISTDTSYAASLSRSLSLVLEDFYGNMPSVGVSSVTGSGMDEFFNLVDASVEEYNENYKKTLESNKSAEKVGELLGDMKVSGQGAKPPQPHHL